MLVKRTKWAHLINGWWCRIRATPGGGCSGLQCHTEKVPGLNFPEVRGFFCVYCARYSHFSLCANIFPFNTFGFCVNTSERFPSLSFEVQLSHRLQTVGSSLQCGKEACTENPKYNRILILHCCCCLINKHHPVYSWKRIIWYEKQVQTSRVELFCIFFFFLNLMRNWNLIATFCPFVGRFWQCEHSASHSSPMRPREQSRLLAENG